ncbi:MAG: electron transport complex subunit RsxG, partial [Aeromonas veronii]
MLKSMRKNGLILAMFALGCTALVVLTNELTKDKIAHQQQLEKQQTLSVLLPEGSYDNDLVASCKQV